ncbi:hypothetical protein MSAN_01074200 [Mycena sanguinolenta]|uniref:Uncharacterized protein n=1 Tax=Mycena sanguinolenta TaxID=230812 RepID=A0A8H7D7E3_9AGAR|nr:hypothetical protein MSAN_01074200 [Mycena sanguinolenta]
MVSAQIEPLKYRTFILTGPSSTCRRFGVLQHAIKSKPAQFIRDNVWHLLVHSNFQEDTLDTFIPFCTGVRSLVLLGPHTRMFSQLETARPRRLATRIEFFGPKVDESMIPNLGLPMFSSLTHLDVFGHPLDTETGSSLALLPALTHLASLELSYDVAVAILGMCQKLQVLINMYPSHNTIWPTLSATVHDWEPRFLAMALTTEDYILDWEAGLRGGSDFWARADVFVAMRRRGEIEPESRYWIEERDGI